MTGPLDSSGDGDSEGGLLIGLPCESCGREAVDTFDAGDREVALCGRCFLEDLESSIGTDEYAAVRVDNPAVPHTFVLKPDQIRAKARRVREHSNDEEAAEEFAERLEEAIDAAETMEV